MWTNYEYMTVLISLLYFLNVQAFNSVLPISRTRLLSTVREKSQIDSSSPSVSIPVNEVPILDTKPNENLDEDKFEWFKSWYPVVPIEFLDETKPHHYNLLGIDLCIWNDFKENDTFGPKLSKKKSKELKKEGEWHAFEDSCPHRKVPLSEGRVERDGTLLCSYHGWRFEGEGSCVSVPQEDGSEEKLKKMLSNPRSKCNAFPTKIVNGILWVWPDSSADAFLESALSEIPAATEILDDEGNILSEDRLYFGPYNFRELPYGADYFVENVVDPAHVPVSHHNIIGNRYTDSLPIHISVEENISKKGFKVATKLQANLDTNVKSTCNFSAPSLVTLDSSIGDGGMRQILELYISPSKPGFSNHCGRLVLVKDKDGNLPKTFEMFTKPVPKWVNHLLAAKFLNQDALFLHAQERAFSKSGKYTTALPTDEEDMKLTLSRNEDYKMLTYTPNQADKGVILFREWLRRKAGGGIPFRNNIGPTSMPPQDNEIVFDQWTSHTAKCKSCLAAYKGVRKFRNISIVLAALSAIWVPSVGGRKIAATASTALFGGAGYLSNKVLKAFKRSEFSHAEND